MFGELLLFNYKNILLAIDLTEESDQVIERGKALQQLHNARLNLIYVTEPIHMSYASDIPVDASGIQEQVQEQAQERLASIADELNVPSPQRFLVMGRPEAEIHRVAEEEECDLIIIGSHGHQGLAILLGSMAGSVLHGTKCDVLAVRIAESEELIDS